jgi:cellulose synthase/poly-beta-1,6-N-acetylglucosamine synthase-like glycosyltransferase
LNRIVPTLAGEVVVFSDANAMYERDALLNLVRNFADPSVGCVTGEARYLAGAASAADASERTYWNYEIQIKRDETTLGSMVGGDGAIYAIRRTLWRQLPADAINDFLNPLQIVAAGWRVVYEPEAICHEATAGDVRAECRRRVRIVSRSWRAVFQADGVLNPLRVGLFTWSLVSHKILRWFSGVFLAVAIVGLLVALIPMIDERPAASFATLVALAVLAAATRRGRQLAAGFAYFAAITAASLIGVLNGSVGRVSGVWSTPRHTVDSDARRPGASIW